jgi:hypothetical protein
MVRNKSASLYQKSAITEHGAAGSPEGENVKYGRKMI